jgi:hypothetical protein
MAHWGLSHKRQANKQTNMAKWRNSKHNFLSVGLIMIFPPFKATIWYFFVHVIKELAAR